MSAKMSVKIFLPSALFYTKVNCDIYGEININENNAVSYFVIAACPLKDADIVGIDHNFRHLGHIMRTNLGIAADTQRRDVALSFAFDEQIPNIYLEKLGIKPLNATNANVFLYNVCKVRQLHTSRHTRSCGSDNDALEQFEDIPMLLNLVRDYPKKAAAAQCMSSACWSDYILAAINLPLDAITYLFLWLMQLGPLVFLLQRTVFFEHYLEWEKFRASGKRNINIALDKILGISVMLIILFCEQHPADYFLKTSYFIVDQLRYLLFNLKGNPIGMKLNVHLNDFFLECFNYHIDLWAAFLDLIEPHIQKLFMPMALFGGSVGLSYQLAMLTDLISVIGLHAHCFYIYAAVLYKVEINGIQVLWKAMLGKRYNILKHRVEAHNYSNRQLYLATIFFTTMLFLFPTILVYYIVFTTLRLLIYLISLVLQFNRRYILEFPLETLWNWLKGTYYEIEGIQLQPLNHERSPLLQPKAERMKMSVFKLSVKTSSVGSVFLSQSGVLQELRSEKTVKDIFKGVLRGKFQR